MNIHNKLRSIGFKKSAPMYRVYIPSNARFVSGSYKLVDGSYFVDKDIYPPDDWTHGYKYKFGKDSYLFCNLRKENNIEIYLVSKDNCVIIEAGDIRFIYGVKDIYSLVPKEIRRQMIIENIINGK